MYRVVLHNDNSTPFEFVIHILVSVFNKNTAEALEITIRVHNASKGTIGIYAKDVAESKSDMANVLAAQHGYELTTSVEKI